MDLIKGKSKWLTALLIDSEHLSFTDHFVFAFKIKNTYDLLNFTFTLLDGKGYPVKYKSIERKAPVLGFKIQIIKWMIKKEKIQSVTEEFKNLIVKTHKDFQIEKIINEYSKIIEVSKKNIKLYIKKIWN